MKQKLLDALRAKYKNMGFSEAAINAMVSHLEASVTAEDQVEAAVAGVEPLLKAFQAHADSRVNAAVDKVKAESGQGKGGENQPGGADPKEPANPSDEPPAWAKTLIEDNKALREKVSAIELGKSTDSRKAQLEEALKGVNPKFKEATIEAFEMIPFKDDAAFTGYLEKVKTNAAEFIQEEANSGLSKAGNPIIPGATPKGSFVEMMGKIGETATAKK